MERIGGWEKIDAPVRTGVAVEGIALAYAVDTPLQLTGDGLNSAGTYVTTEADCARLLGVIGFARKCVHPEFSARFRGVVRRLDRDDVAVGLKQSTSLPGETHDALHPFHAADNSARLLREHADLDGPRHRHTPEVQDTA